MLVCILLPAISFGVSPPSATLTPPRLPWASTPDARSFESGTKEQPPKAIDAMSNDYSRFRLRKTFQDSKADNLGDFEIALRSRVKEPGGHQQ